MRLDLNYDFASVRCFLEDLGSLRLSAFFPVEKSSQGEKAQKIARFILGIFVVLCAYDFITRSLPFKVRMVVRGTLFLLVSCLSLSILLKPFQKSIKRDSPKEEAPFPETIIPDKENDYAALDEIYIEETSSEEEESEEEITIRPVRRNLLAEFEKLAQE